ncbi:VanZ family protein, partial [bacterium]
GITAFIIAVIYAASDEFHQSFIPGRNADALDWMADSFGAALGSLTILGRDKLRRS